MNFKSALASIITPSSVKEEQEAKKKAQEVQLSFEQQEAIEHHNAWLALHQSKLLLHELNSAYAYHIQRAKDLANEGVKDTSSLLIQATTIEKVIKYVRNRDSITGDTSSNRDR